MARIDRTEVERIAALAKLSLTDEQAERLAAELGSILVYVETLAELDTTDVEPTSHPIALPTPVRDDERDARIEPAEALANAPESTDTSFVVPRVIDSEIEF